MTYSAGEFAALAQRAALGAGFPPAQADSFGTASVHHLRADGAPEALLEALSDVSDSPILRLPLLMEDILRVLPLSGPLIELTLQPGDETLVSGYLRGLPVTVAQFDIIETDGPPRLRLTATRKLRTPQPPPARIDAPEELLTELRRLSARSYVPSTAASRRSGAGAGEIDND